MVIVFISDTHNKHHQIKLPPGDMIIHCGDVTSGGTKEEIKDFLNWFSALPHKHKIFIAGNHDFYIERMPEHFRTLIPDNVIYLENEAIEIGGYKIWGSPITPWFYDWAFNKDRGKKIKKYWKMIPEDVDILLTHGPPAGVLDFTVNGIRAGCQDLYEKVLEVKPALHVFGHIHEDSGQMKLDGIKFINASLLDVRYNIVNAPVVIVL